jgi:hypothetical protein
MDDLIKPDQPPEPTESTPSAEPSSGEPVAAGQAADSKPPTSDQCKVAMRKVKDPELNLNIIDLGQCTTSPSTDQEVQIDMTLTSPGRRPVPRSWATSSAR